MDAIDVDSVQKNHMEVDIEVNRTTKSLNQRNCAGLCPGSCKARSVGQVRGNSAIDDAQHNGLVLKVA